jgi:hypothetical protein
MLILNQKNNFSYFSKIFILLIGLLSIIAYVKCYNGQCYNYGSYRSSTRGSAAHHSGGSCFDDKSTILMSHGNNSLISNIKKGDFILGWDINNDIKSLEVEELVIHHGTFQLYGIKLKNNQGIRYTRDFITQNHPLMLLNNKWCSLKIENKLFDIYDNNLMVKECQKGDTLIYYNQEYQIEETFEGRIVNTVYDIETKGYQNSFLTDSIRVID